MTGLQDKLRSHFAQRVLSAKLWIVAAENLISAAERLMPEIERFWSSLDALGEQVSMPLSAMVGSEYQNISMMLYGFAIENFCKAHAVTKLSKVDRVFLRKGILPRRLKTHRLEYLVTKEVGLVLNDGERELLKRLEAAVKWAGRYPVSTGPMDQRKQAIKEQLLAMPQGLGGDDLVRTRQLAGRIENEVRV